MSLHFSEGNFEERGLSLQIEHDQFILQSRRSKHQQAIAYIIQPIVYMGSFLSDIEGREVKVDDELLNSSHSKLVEYYSSYKSICEGYTINVPEYTHIFGPNQLSFEVWDTKHRGKIDAIEMFTGLIVFSSISFQQKIKFLFEVFDFNEEGNLYYENISLLLINICNATYKIYSLPKTASHSTIEQFLDDYFTQESQISYHKLLRWTLRVPLIGDYFRGIGHHIKQLQEEKQIAELSGQQYDQLMSKTIKVYYSSKEAQLDSAFFNNLQLLFNREGPESKEQIREAMNLTVDWVFGINCKVSNIKYTCSKGLKAANERIVYTVGKIIIIYFPKLNIQHYYKEHTQSISVIEISKGQRFAASGEEGNYPEIHIWDLRTNSNVLKFKKLHKDSINFLHFFKDDKQLITTSGNSLQSPLIILDISTQEILMSTYLQYSIIGIVFNQEFPLKGSDFLVVSGGEFAFFSQQKDVSQLISQKTKFNEKILCFSFNSKGLLVTGHLHRKLYCIDQKFGIKQITYASSYDRQLKALTFLGQEQLLLMDELDIEVLRFEQNLVSRVYALKLQEARIYNTRLLHMQKIQDDQLLLLSEFGDVIKVVDLNHLEQPTFHKYQQIFRLLYPQDYCFYGENRLLIVAGHFIYSVDRYEREICVLAKMEWQIQTIQCSKDSLVLLGWVDEKTKILASIRPADFSLQETCKIPCKAACIVIADNYLLVFLQNSLSVFHKTQEKFFEKQPSIHPYQFGTPVSVSQSAERQTFVLFNDMKEMFKFTLGSHSQVDFRKIAMPSAFLFNTLSAYFSFKKENFPFCANLPKNFFALAQSNGDILVWNSMSQALANHNGAMKMSFHCGRVSKLIIKEEELISLGVEDGMVVLMKHSSYHEQAETEPFVEQSGNGSEERQKYQQQNPFKQKEAEQSQEKGQWKIEQLGSSFLKESEVELQPLQQSEHSYLKEIIKEIIHPKDKMSYESQMRESASLNLTKVSLSIQGIYGLSCKNSLSVFYRHIYTKQPSPLSALNKQNQLLLESGQKKTEDFHFSQTLLLPLDDSHLGCNRQYLYFIDRLCVLREGRESRQRIYDFHRRKVTCIAIHPDRQLIISCQESTTNPIIHLWDADQLATKAIISTRHNQIISRAAFSRDGEWVVTLGGRERLQSIQVTSWRNEQEITFRLVEGQILRDILFNPYERTEISVIGKQIIKVFKYKAGVFVLSDQHRALHDFCSVTYTSSVYGDSIESDLIIGNSIGDLGIFICGKYISAKQNAHSGAIFCLRVAELFGYKRVLITGGADSMVKIWDIKFNELSRKNIQQELYSFRINGEDRPECIITSLDVYQCLKGQGVDRPPTLLLIATSDGSVLQATIHNEFQGYQTRSLTTNEVHQLKEKINFDVSLLFSGPPSEPATEFQIYKSILVTYNSETPFLQFWSLQSWERAFLFKLPDLPSVLCFMNESPILMVAYRSLAVNFFSLYQMQFQNQLIKGLKLLGQVPLIKGHGEPISAIFSQKDNRLALLFSLPDSNQVCFFNRYPEAKNVFQGSGKIENEFYASFMEFNRSGEVIVVAWTDPKRIQQEYTIKCYNSDSQEELPVIRFDFRRFDFSKRIKANYIQCSNFSKVQQQILSKFSLKISTMAQYDRYLLLGTNHGQVLVVQGSFFMRKSQDERLLVRSFILCDNPIKSLQVKDDFLFVSSERGESVLKIRLSLEEAWNLPAAAKSIYNQTLSVEALQSKIRHVFAKRTKMQTQEEINSKPIQGKWLKLARVIGRSAFTKRNNIFVDLKDCIICYSGCNILINKFRHGQQLQQLVIKPNPAADSIHPQISAMALAENKRLLVVGTAEEKSSKLLLWNISTNTFLQQIQLPGFPLINIIKLSLSSRKSAVVATSSKGAKYLLYLDLPAKRVIGVYRLVDINLNDVCFAGEEEQKILGCGPNYMGEWVFKNGILIPKMYSLGNNQDLLGLKASGIIFYSLIFIEDMAISSGSDGYLYVWKEGKLAKRQNAHPDFEVLSLYAATNSKIFASGGTNGRVVIWKVWTSMIIQHQGEYPKEGNLKFPVQSISMTRDTLIVGDTSGAIMQFAFGGEEGGYQTLLAPFDHEPINSCAFSTASKRLYVITSEGSWGTFAIFDTTSFEKLRQQRIEFKSQLIRMLACKLTNRIFFVMKNSIAEYSVVGEGKEERGKLLKFKWSLKCDAGIKTATLSSEESYLAVLVAQSTQHQSKIQIYNLLAPETHYYNFYKIYKVEENIPASIDLIDFCIDHDYLLYQGPDEEQTILDLMTKEKVKISSIENELEWAEEAKKISPSVSDITALYSQENRLLRLVKVKNKCLVATDEMGSVRVFVKGVLSQVCIEHLNEVYICVVSPYNRQLVTVSRVDRAMHFWELTDQEQQK